MKTSQALAHPHRATRNCHSLRNLEILIHVAYDVGGVFVRLGATGNVHFLRIILQANEEFAVVLVMVEFPDEGGVIRRVVVELDVQRR